MILKRTVIGSAAFIMSIMSCSVLGAEKDDLKNITGTYYEALIQEGKIDEDSKSSDKKEDIKVKDVYTVGESIIAVCFDGFYENVNVEDIKLQAYTSDWNSLEPVLKDRITVDKYAITKNEQGETVVFFKIKEKINGDVMADEEEIPNYSDEEKTEILKTADNIVSWQMEHGGWDKDYDLHKSRLWDGKEPKNLTSGWYSLEGEPVPLGTIDNSSTYTHMRDIAVAYTISEDKKYKESFEKGMEFLDLLQCEKGGFTQVYPKRGNYSDYVTFNDNAMVGVLKMLKEIEDGSYPYNTGIADNYKEKASKMIEDSIDYILKAQIVNNGKKTAWCAQHDPETYEPRPARAYEPISISGSESVGIIRFLLTQRDNKEAVEAAEAALKWFEEKRIANVGYDKKKEPPFFEKEGSSIWYRFYEIGTEKPIFGDRDESIHYDLNEVSEERRKGYTWAGSWAKKVLDVYEKYGYYPNRIVVTFNGEAYSPDNDTKSFDLKENKVSDENIKNDESNNQNKAIMRIMPSNILHKFE